MEGAMKLKQALELFLLEDRAPQSRETYRRFLVRFVEAIGPERPLDLITPQDIDAYILDMRESRVKYATHRKRSPVNEPLSPATIYKRIKMIKTFFKWCVDRELLDLSPAGHLKNPRPRRPLGQGKACTDDELEQILAAARFKPRDRALVLLLAESGCRAEEAAGLQMRNLELAQNSAVVDGKGARRRRIFYTEQAADALHVWLEKRPSVEHDYVFTSIRGHGRLSARAVSEVIRRLCRVAGLSRRLGAHSLRHRVGLTFARRRVAPRITQHYLGHEDIHTTLEYYQDVDEDDLRAAGRLVAPGYEEEGWQREAKENPAGKRLKPPMAAGL
jgi:site-specific recombinase XerD